SVQGEGLLAGARVPDLDLVIEAGGGEPAAVAAERHAPDDLGVSLQTAEEPAGRDVPDLDGAMILRIERAAGHGEIAAVPTIDRPMAPARVTGQDLHRLTAFRIDECQFVLICGRGETSTVRTERHELEPTRVANGPDRPVGRRVPDHDGRVVG